MLPVAAYAFAAGVCIAGTVASWATFGRFTGIAWFTLTMGLINLAAVVVRLLA